MTGMLGLIAALVLLIYLTMRGVNIIIAAILCSVVVAVTGRINVETALTQHYMEGFTGYFSSWFLIFLLGAIFGKVMQTTLAADSIANWARKVLGPSRAVLAVVAAAAVMTYGGVSLFVVGFSIYPIALSLFRIANYPHRLIPAALVFGSISFTMTAPGSPEIQNLIPTKFFGTTPGAGGIIGFVIAGLIMISGAWYLSWVAKKAVDNGESFSLPGDVPKFPAAEILPDPNPDANVTQPATASAAVRSLPHVVLAFLPLITVIVILNTVSAFTSPTVAALVSLSSGIVMAWIVMFRFDTRYWTTIGVGTQDALIAAANTCAVVGFGSVASKVPAFGLFVNALVDLPGPPLLGLAVAIMLICGFTGSASGGLGIALPILAPIYLSQGLDPGSLHRISTLAAGGLDSLPHNGYIVTTIRAICGETHRRSYKDVFVVSVLIPTVFLLLAVVLYSL